jgi:hypothetical protein
MPMRRAATPDRTMFCSPLLPPPTTRIPAPLRRQIGAWMSGPPRGPRKQSHRACLFLLGRIGDFVLALSTVRLLLGQIGPKHCTLVVSRSQERLARREFPNTRCLVLPTEADGLVRDILPIWWRERGKFADTRFKLLVGLRHQRALYHDLTLSWIDAEREVRLEPSTYPTIPQPGLCTELLGHWRLAESVLGRKVSREEILPRFTSLQASDDGRLLVCPLSLDVTRSLRAEDMLAALQIWRRRNPAPIVFGGSPTDEPALVQLAASARAAGLGDVRVEAPHGLDSLLAQVARAGAVFAADSAPAHIAIALDKPCVVMTSRGFYGYAQPWARSARQQTFLHGTSATEIAAALPALA